MDEQKTNDPSATESLVNQGISEDARGTGAQTETLTPEAKIGLGNMSGEGRAQDQEETFSDTPLKGIRTWGRFRGLRLLGSGGMGEVYEAFDPQLQRRVAVKVLREDHPETAQTFVAEARKQARVQHENICPIYEVGETEGQPFIVMQLINGRTLSAAAQAMTLEQKILVMIRVASAVHEANRSGLVHRDIKPGNIMIEELEDGELKPWVMDFGVARLLGNPLMTADGRFVGTPAFAAPEQVRGRAREIERRTDVYGLGATLYSLLSGGPPFSGPTPRILQQVIDSPPRPLRSLGVPADVETMTLKCLEKEPRRRYTSARALAEDLQRYLDGDPIEARPVGRLTRVVMRARKHKLTVALAATIVVVLIGATVWGGFSRLQAKRREHLVQDFTSQVEQIEAVVRYSHMAPLHDRTDDQLRLQESMDRIRQQIDTAGSIAEGPGHYALGRGYLALGNLEKAREHLNIARESGSQDQRTIRALVTTLSSLYREKLSELEVLDDEKLRGQQRKILQTEFQTPALDLMNGIKSVEFENDPYLGALRAMHRQEYEKALDILTSSSKESAWLYELDLLAGDILRERALLLDDSGMMNEAKASLRGAIDAYMRAKAIAPSNPLVRLGTSQANLHLMQVGEFDREGIEKHYQAGLDMIRSAAVCWPNESRIPLVEARLHLRMAERLKNRIGNPEPYYDLALAAAQKAVDQGDHRGAEIRELGIIQVARARFFRALGRHDDRTAALDAAITAFNSVPESGRDFRFFNSLGIAQMGQAEVLLVAGKPSFGAYRNSIESFRQANLRNPGSYLTYHNRGVALRQMSKAPEEKDRVGLLNEAIHDLRTAVELKPDHPVPHYTLGLCLLDLSNRGDPFTEALGPEVNKALESFRRGLELKPNMYQFHTSIGQVLYLKAIQNLEIGDNPEPFFEEATASHEAAMELNPKYVFPYLNQGWVDYYRGKFKIRSGESGSADLKRALEHAEHSLSLVPQTGAHLCIGSVWRMSGEQELRDGQDPTQSISRSKEALQTILTQDATMPSVHRALGRLQTLNARWMMNSGKDPSPAFDAAGISLKRALELKPQTPSFCLAEARLCLYLVRWKNKTGADTSATIQRGLSYADRAIYNKPGWAEARAVRAALMFQTQGPGTQIAAEKELRSAIEDNPHLEFEWGSYLNASEGPL